MSVAPLRNGHRRSWTFLNTQELIIQRKKVSSILKDKDDRKLLFYALNDENNDIVSAALDVMKELLNMRANRELIRERHPDVIETLDTIRSYGDGGNSLDAETMYQLLLGPEEDEPPLPEYIQDDEEAFPNPGAVWSKNDENDDQSILGKLQSFWQKSFYW